MLQVLFAGMGAAGFAALRLRTGSLWPGIALHAGYDLIFRVVVVQPGTAFANTLYTLHGLGWLLFAVVVLRKRRSARGEGVPTPAGVTDGLWADAQTSAHRARHQEALHFNSISPATASTRSRN